MARLEEIDSNFKIETDLGVDNIRFYDVLEAPFHIYGVAMLDGRFRRMPKAVAAQTNKGVLELHTNTAGGRVRFKTNSSYVAISAKMENVCNESHVAFTGVSGFDLYVKDEKDFQYRGSFRPRLGMETGYESLIHLDSKQEREILIHFPTYSDVTALHIGVEDDAIVEAAKEYAYEKPFVAYGSSITQGGCASRSGNAYESVLSRRFDIDHINLGFSGSARAEDVMAEYVSNLEMSFFLYDYDHNAPTAEHYRNTHEKMFQKVRAAHPDIPILIMTRPKYCLNEDELARREIAYKTYENALAAGDKRVWFMDGKQLMALCGDEGTVDNCHPTDFGFHSMAKAIGDWMEENKILEMI